jgi:hypothetical protein
VKYKLLAPCKLKLKGGRVLSAVGAVFDLEDVHPSVQVDILTSGNVIAPVEEAPASKPTKELTTENAPRRRGRKPKGD